VARYTAPDCRICRREGIKLYLKGLRCNTEKCAVNRRSYAPGQHGRGRVKPTDYRIHLREKQKIKMIYGILEKQFRNYFEMASGMRGVTGTNLLALLERRMDNMVYRLGFASSRPEARQLVLHGHFQVNGKKVTIPSYLVRPGDIINVKEKSRQSLTITKALDVAQSQVLPAWLTRDQEKFQGSLVTIPTRDAIPVECQEQLVVEFYSK
jgi:small subunit ribosomal protein S4